MIEIPNILEFLEFFSFMRGPLGGYVLLLTASVVFVVRDWRWSIFALLIQYLIAGFFFSDVLEPQYAFM